MSFDVIVIGGSFAGLSAAMQLARARRRVLIVDGGQPRNRTAAVAHGFFGHDGKTPSQMLEAARKQVLRYPTSSLIADQVIHASGSIGAFEVILGSGARHRAARLILATGVVDDLPAVEGLEERWGVSVLHCPYCHGYEVADRHLGVVAAGPMSVNQALLLTDWSAQITLFVNRMFTPNETQLAKLGERGVKIELRAIAALHGEAPEIESVELEDGERIAVGALFTSSSTRLASPLAMQLGCALDEGPCGPLVHTDAEKQTSIPGVYAAGDLTSAPHNASGASGDGVRAGIAAHEALVLS